MKHIILHLRFNFCTMWSAVYSAIDTEDFLFIYTTSFELDFVLFLRWAVSDCIKCWSYRETGK